MIEMNSNKIQINKIMASFQRGSLRAQQNDPGCFWFAQSVSAEVTVVKLRSAYILRSK